jgi:hypothetical protein
MERVAAELDMECLAHARIRDSIVVLGSAGKPRRGLPSERIGQRTPFAAPLGTLFVPPDDEAQMQRWISPPGMSPRNEAQAERFRALASRAQEREWSVVLNTPGQIALEATVGGASVESDLSEAWRILTGEVDVEGYEAEIVPGRDYAVRHLIVPVRNAGGEVVLNLSLYGLPRLCSAADIDTWRTRLAAAADAVARSLPIRTQ